MRRHFFERRGHDSHEVPMLNTSALPDLIFTVLFFFMIVTHMRDVTPLVRYDVPRGTEVQKPGHKGSISHIYVGRTADSPDQYYIQLGSRLASIDDIPAFIEQERAMMSTDDQARMTVSISADRDVPMSIISDIKHALQQQYALRISYTATPENNKQ